MSPETITFNPRLSPPAGFQHMALAPIHRPIELILREQQTDTPDEGPDHVVLARWNPFLDGWSPHNDAAAELFEPHGWREPALPFAGSAVAPGEPPVGLETVAKVVTHAIRHVTGSNPGPAAEFATLATPADRQTLVLTLELGMAIELPAAWVDRCVTVEDFTNLCFAQRWARDHQAVLQADVKNAGAGAVDKVGDILMVMESHPAPYRGVTTLIPLSIASRLDGGPTAVIALTVGLKRFTLSISEAHLLKASLLADSAFEGGDALAQRIAVAAALASHRANLSARPVR